jgi:hypothetical protein
VSDDKAVRFQKPQGDAEGLRFTVELLQGDGEVERILARVQSLPLARAVFEAGKEEYRGRTLVLREGSRELARSPPD